MAQVEEVPKREDGGRAPDALRKTAALIAVALALVSSLSPLFGSGSVGAVLPLPQDLEKVGGPLITGITLFLVLLVFVELLNGEMGKHAKYLGGATFLVGLLLLGTYMSWMTSDGIVPPTMPVAANVVSLFIVGFGIAFFAISMVVLAAILVLEPSKESVLPPPPLSTDKQADRATLRSQSSQPAVEKLAKSSQSATERLMQLVLIVHWSQVERESRHVRSPYWFMYGAAARMLVIARPDKKDVQRLRFWVRLLSFTRAMQLWSSERADRGNYLLAIAAGYLPWFVLRTELWHKIESFGDTPADWTKAFNYYLMRFLSLKVNPDYLGYSWLITEADRTLSELLSFRRAIPPLHQISVLTVGQGAASLARFQTLGAGAMSTIEADFQAALILAATQGTRKDVATAAYAAADKFFNARSAYPTNSSSWIKATNFATYSYCLGAAAGGAASDNSAAVKGLIYLVERSRELLHVDTPELADRLATLIGDGVSAIRDDLRTRAQQAINHARSLKGLYDL